MKREARFLILLAVCHYLTGVLAFVCGLMAVQVTLLGTGIAGGAVSIADWPYPPWLLGGILVWMSLIALVYCFALSVSLCIVGGCLRRRDKFRFCQIAAGASGIFVPFGTALAAMTLIFLGKPSVRKLFDESGYPNQVAEENS